MCVCVHAGVKIRAHSCLALSGICLYKAKFYSYCVSSGDLMQLSQDNAGELGTPHQLIIYCNY